MSYRIFVILEDLTYFYLAAVLLKQFIKKHWEEGEDSFEYPAVSSDEKVNGTFQNASFFCFCFKAFISLVFCFLFIISLTYSRNCKG